MPLARIITPTAADASPIAERLRAHGYTVEVVSAEQVHISPADLEVDLQKCSRHEALAQAAEAARRSGAEEIFVHPDAVSPEALAASAAKTQQQRAVRGTRGMSATLKQKQAELTHWWEEHFQRRQHQRPTVDRDAEPEVYAAKRVDAAAAQPNADELRQQIEQARQAEAERVRRAEAERLQRAEAARRRLEEAAAERGRQQEEAARVAREAESRRIRQEEEAARVAREAEVLRSRQQEEAARLAREAEDRQAAEMRERLRRETEERQRAEEAASAAARVEQERKQTEEAAARVTRYAEQSVAADAPSALPAQAWSSGSAISGARPRAQRLRQREREWRLAFVVAVFFAALLVVGWSAVTDRRPAAPLSNSELNKASDIKQEVPFGPATLGPGNTPAPAAKPAQPSVSVDAMVPVPHAPPSSMQKPSAAAPKTPKRARKRVRRTAEDDDVVVHHFGSSPPKAKADMNAGMKRYSDLE